MAPVSQILDNVDLYLSYVLVPLAVWVLVNGIDDLIVDAIWIFSTLCRRKPKRPDAGANPQTPTAIFVPLWQEHTVIQRMVEHNIATIAYDDYHFFVGVYPNDELTVAAVRELEADHARVHLAMCPHDGPTSKADCLNWIYQRVLLYEEEHGVRFDTIVIHDAEDLIHSRALTEINTALATCDMVQVPVLALPTPVANLTHGIYCDEFAEYQMRDMPAREAMRAFLPSCGVGTGYRRDALERLAVAESNRIFDPACLTEDYENGLRLHELGCKQAFVRLDRSQSPVATREYFPRNMRAAIRQRARWAMGNLLQSWERHGWRGDLAQVYWLWRDRKGIAGSILTAAANLLTVYSLLRLPAGGGLSQSAVWTHIGPITAALLMWRIAVRTVCAARVYGWRFAVAVPVRMLYGNCINAISTTRALWTYGRAKWRGEPLRWIKTAHAYPNREALEAHKRPLEEVLACFVDLHRLAAAIEAAPDHIGEYLVDRGHLTEGELTAAIGMRENVPVAHAAEIDPAAPATRALPARVLREFCILPFRIEEGRMHIASATPPAGDIHVELRRFTSLRIRIHLVTPAEFDALSEQVLPHYAAR